MNEERIAWLNARLPRTRAIAHARIRDAKGRVLLCRLTYKDAWDLPGGVIERGESPLLGCVREVEEELGLTVAEANLAAVNWLPPWRGWDDALVFLFDLGVHDDDLPRRCLLQATEIAEVAWCDYDEIGRRAAAATTRLLHRLHGEVPASPLYLEDGGAPGESAWGPPAEGVSGPGAGSRAASRRTR